MSETEKSQDDDLIFGELPIQHAVLTATYSDFKLIKTRQVISVSFEIPLESYELVHRVLGMPNPAEELAHARAAYYEAEHAIRGLDHGYYDSVFAGWERC